MKKLLLASFIFFTSGFFTDLSAQMACKDTVFNVDYSQNMCLFNIWGDWSVDSVLDGNRKLMNDEYTGSWSFDASLGYRTHTKSKNVDVVETCKYKFTKGYMELENCESKGIKVLSKLAYKILYLSPKRLEVQFAYSGEGSYKYSILILHKK